MLYVSLLHFETDVEFDDCFQDMDKASQLVGAVMPPKVKAARIRPMAITDDMKTFKANAAIRQARTYKRLHGIREKRKADAEADDITGGKGKK